MTMIRRAFYVLATALVVASVAMLSGTAFAADAATKAEALAMVEKAVAYIKAQGADKAYAEIDNPSGQFVDRDLYIVVYGLDGMVLAHGADKARVGTNQIDDKDFRRKGLRQGAGGSGQAAADLLADLQVHEPDDQEGRAQADVLPAPRSDGRLRRRLRFLTAHAYPWRSRCNHPHAFSLC